MSKTPQSNGSIIYEIAKSGNITDLKDHLNKQHYTHAELNWKNPGNGLTPLLIACQENKFECVKKLVETEGVDVNAVDRDGRTGLFIAAEFGHPEVVRELLLSRNIDIKKSPTSGDTKGKTPLQIAKSYKDIRKYIPTLIKPPVEFENYENMEKQIEDFEKKPPKLARHMSSHHVVTTEPPRRLGGRGSISKSNKRKSTNRKYKKNRKTKRSRR